MSVMESLVTRRTYRRFAQKPVPQDVVDDIVEAVRLSSCGANRQALRLVVVQSPEMVAKVQPLVKWAAYLPPEQGMPKADETPTLYVAVLQDSSASGDLSTDTGIALANMTLAAWDKGVGSCIMGAINISCKRIISQEFSRVCTHRFALLFQRLLLRYIGSFFHKRFLRSEGTRLNSSHVRTSRMPSSA